MVYSVYTYSMKTILSPILVVTILAISSSIFVTFYSSVIAQDFEMNIPEEETEDLGVENENQGNNESNEFLTPMNDSEENGESEETLPELERVENQVLEEPVSQMYD